MQSKTKQALKTYASDAERDQKENDMGARAIFYFYKVIYRQY